MIRHIASSLDLPDSIARRLALLSLALFFVVVGIDHFLRTDFYVSIMPPYIPAHFELVLISGGLEIAGGLSLLLGFLRRFTSLCLMALLIAVYPANVHMAMNPDLFPAFEQEALYARLLLQFVFLYWVYEVGFRKIVKDV